jgi:hypothetical protein
MKKKHKDFATNYVTMEMKLRSILSDLAVMKQPRWIWLHVLSHSCREILLDKAN